MVLVDPLPAPLQTVREWTGGVIHEAALHLGLETPQSLHLPFGIFLRALATEGPPCIFQAGP